MWFYFCGVILMHVYFVVIQYKHIETLQSGWHFCRWHFEMHFFKWKWTHFHSNLNSRYVTNASGNGLVLNRNNPVHGPMLGSSIPHWVNELVPGKTADNIINSSHLDKMAAISQTLYSDAFSWMKMYKFQLRFHWTLFLRVQLTIFQYWFR